MTKKKTIMMRVPLEFKSEVERITKKRKYGTNTEFLRSEGIKVLRNSDYVTDMIGGLFSTRRKKRK